jgi:hypothetical protein
MLRGIKESRAKTYWCVAAEFYAQHGTFRAVVMAEDRKAKPHDKVKDVAGLMLATQDWFCTEADARECLSIWLKEAARTGIRRV